MASHNIRAVTRYETPDGTLHDSLKAAQKHAAQHKAMASVSAALKRLSPSNSFGTLHIDITNKPELALELRAAVNNVLDYHRRYGKLKKV